MTGCGEHNWTHLGRGNGNLPVWSGGFQVPTDDLFHDVNQQGLSLRAAHGSIRSSHAHHLEHITNIVNDYFQKMEYKQQYFALHKNSLYA
jgi:hypothetical protein